MNKKDWYALYQSMITNVEDYDVFDTFLVVAAIESKRGVTLDLRLPVSSFAKVGTKALSL